MSTYAISDIHGHLEMFNKLLKKIGFEKNSSDELYLLGDYGDFGEANAKTLFTVMEMDKTWNNVHCLIGNHDLMLMNQLHSYNHTPLKEDIYYDKNYLYCNGGKDTFNGVLDYSMDKQIELEKWIDSLPYRLDITVNDKKFTLVHSDIQPIRDKSADDFEFCRKHAVWNRTIGDIYNRKLREEIYKEYLTERGVDNLIIGHTIVNKFQDCTKPFEVQYFCDKRIVDIDCGCKIAYNSYFKYYELARLAAFRLDDFSEFYVD